MKRPRRLYTDEQRKELLAQIEAQKDVIGLVKACESVEVDSGSYYKWRRQFMGPATEPKVVTYSGKSAEKVATITRAPKATRMAAIIGTPEQIAEFLKGSL